MKLKAFGSHLTWGMRPVGFQVMFAASFKEKYRGIHKP